MVRSQSKHLKGLPAGKAAVITSSGLRYVDRADYVPEVVVPAPPGEKRSPRRATENEKKMLTAARELRDRFLEKLNSGLILPAGKYQICKQLHTSTAPAVHDPLDKDIPLLLAKLLHRGVIEPVAGTRNEQARKKNRKCGTTEGGHTLADDLLANPFSVPGIGSALVACAGFRLVPEA